jgi:hypothetical protein
VCVCVCVCCKYSPAFAALTVAVCISASVFPTVGTQRKKSLKTHPNSFGVFFSSFSLSAGLGKSCFFKKKLKQAGSAAKCSRTLTTHTHIHTHTGNGPRKR